MQAIQLPSLEDHVRALPADAARRDRQLHRLVDLYASTEALAALQTEARRNADGPLTTALVSAAAVMGERLGLANDPAAFDRLRNAVTAPDFLARFSTLVGELRRTASTCADSGACTVATALELWSWTMDYFCKGYGARPESISQVIDELAEAIAPLLAARSFALDVATQVPKDGDLAIDLARVNAARASAQTGATCAELVFGYRRHLTWDAEGCATCYGGDDVDELEAFMPGIASGARMTASVVEADGSHAAKAGPCARFDGLDTFVRLRTKLDGCLTGTRFARDRAAASIARTIAATEGRA